MACTVEIRGGFIGECTGVLTPVSLDQCSGVQINQIQKYGIIPKVFPFFLRVLIFKMFLGHTPEPHRDLVPSAFELLGSQLNALPPPPKELQRNTWLLTQHHPRKTLLDPPLVEITCTSHRALL